MEEKSYSPGLEGIIATETRISFLDVEREAIIVRGYNLLELIRTATYIDVLGILVDEKLPDAQRKAAFEHQLTTASVPGAVYEILAKLPSSMHAMDRLRTALSALAGFDPEANTADPERERAKAPRLVGQIAQIVANLTRVASGDAPKTFTPEHSFAENFLRTIVGRDLSAAEVRAFEQTLIAYSEHELPNSTDRKSVV